MKKKKKNVLTIMALTWYLILSTFAGAYVYINYLTPEYEAAYWTALFFYAAGIYMSIAAYVITKEDKP